MMQACPIEKNPFWRGAGFFFSSKKQCSAGDVGPGNLGVCVCVCVSIIISIIPYLGRYLGT